MIQMWLKGVCNDVMSLHADLAEDWKLSSSVESRNPLTAANGALCLPGTALSAGAVAGGDVVRCRGLLDPVR